MSSFRLSQEVAQDSKSKDLKDLHSLIGVSLIFGVASGIMTSGSDYYESNQCVSLLSWTKWYFYYNVFIFIVSIFFYNIIKYDKSHLNSENKLCVKSTFSVFRAFLVMAVCVLFVGFCYSFDLGEPCGELRKFVLGILIIHSTALFLYVCIMFCVCAFAIWTLFKSRREEGKDNKNTELNLKSEINV